jgi:hypothetical protein
MPSSADMVPDDIWNNISEQKSKYKLSPSGQDFKPGDVVRVKPSLQGTWLDRWGKMEGIVLEREVNKIKVGEWHASLWTLQGHGGHYNADWFELDPVFNKGNTWISSIKQPSTGRKFR